jgi:hypothetical protein
MVTTRSSARRSHAPPGARPPAFRLRKGTRRPKKRISAAIGFKLLELPWEIRQIILRDLLWQPEPIFFTSIAPRFTGPMAVRTIDDPAFEDYWINHRERKGKDARKFYPEILSVCKQLHEEGSPILYDNSVNCRINSPDDFERDWHDPSMVILGQRYCYPHDPQECLFTDLPKPVFEKMQKARVEVFASRTWGNFGFLDIQDSVRHLAQILGRSNWKNLTIELKIHEESDYQPEPEKDEYMARLVEDPPYRHQLFKQFLYLRDCKVSITGASTSLTSQLTRVMTSSPDECPVIDLDSMFADMERYVEVSTWQDSYAWAENTDEEQEMIDEIQVSLDDLDGLRRWVDTEAFLKSRSEILRSVSEFLLLRQAAVFAHDPVGTPYEPRGTTLMPDRGDRVWHYVHGVRSPLRLPTP